MAEKLSPVGKFLASGAVRRVLTVFGLVALGVALWGLVLGADDGGPVRFSISFPAARSAQPLDGRVLLFVSDDGRTEPRTQTDQYRANTTRPIFGVDVDALEPGQAVVIDEKIAGWPVRSLKQIPPGEYWVQALLNRYDTFHRADGHTIKMPMDQGEGQKWAGKPGNLYSKPVKMRIDPSNAGEIRISLDLEIPPIERPKDTSQVKYIRLRNERLSTFWGRPMELGAIVLLPFGWDTHPTARYPLVVHHGHFPSTMEGDTWRETPPDANATPQQRAQQEAGYRFYKAWNGPNFPRMIHVLVQHPTPYFDDSYAVNSANNGPYGDAITRDLVPQIEKQFRGIGQGWARATIGGSTGGWEAFGVQVMYPDDYNGAWALCPDPIDFRSYRSVNIYEERNAYFYEEDNPWKRTPKPGYRDYRDHLYSTFEDRNLVELAIGTHGRSGGQHDAWASVFGPVGDDGYYKPLYDKATGVIDPEVARYWRDHYDLRYILARDWATLGRKLRGKIHITSGTMDNGYLNNAVYQMEEFLMRATPSAEAEIIYGERREHCFTGDTEHPNAVGSRTVHQRYMPAMAQWMKKTAPAGADTKSWVY
jgi:hypothetical protein